MTYKLVPRQEIKIGKWYRGNNWNVWWKCLSVSCNPYEGKITGTRNYGETDRVDYFTYLKSGALLQEWIPTEKSNMEQRPTRYKDLSDLEKGLLHLAAHRGKVMQIWSGISWNDIEVFDPGENSHSSFRVKPEPTVETRYLQNAEVEVSYQTVDGVVDWSTLKGRDRT